MADTRKNIKAQPKVKEEVERIRKELGVKTESQALGYLLAMYEDQKSKGITLVDHQKYKTQSENS